MDESSLPTAELSDPVLAALVRSLRLATDASRVTIRGPLAVTGGTTALLAESLGPGVPSMTTGPVSGIVEAGTYVYLREALDILVQPDTAFGPQPPDSLTAFFGVRAQLLGPLVDNGTVVGTISVHQAGQPRDWSKADVAALRQAVETVRELWGLS